VTIGSAREPRELTGNGVYGVAGGRACPWAAINTVIRARNLVDGSD